MILAKPRSLNTTRSRAAIAESAQERADALRQRLHEAQIRHHPDVERIAREHQDAVADAWSLLDSEGADWVRGGRLALEHYPEPVRQWFSELADHLLNNRIRNLENEVRELKALASDLVQTVAELAVAQEEMEVRS